MADVKSIIIGILGLITAIGEMMPFIEAVEANGLLHYLYKKGQQKQDTQCEHEENREADPECQPLLEVETQVDFDVILRDFNSDLEKIKKDIKCIEAKLSKMDSGDSQIDIFDKKMEVVTEDINVLSGDVALLKSKMSVINTELEKTTDIYEDNFKTIEKEIQHVNETLDAHNRQFENMHEKIFNL